MIHISLYCSSHRSFDFIYITKDKPSIRHVHLHCCSGKKSMKLASRVERKVLYKNIYKTFVDILALNYKIYQK